MYFKDSAILVLKAGEDGYVVDYFLFNVNPPPVQRMTDVLASVPAEEDVLDEQGNPTGAKTPGVSIQQQRISTDKATLKTELSQFVDNYFDV